MVEVRWRRDAGTDEGDDRCCPRVASTEGRRKKRVEKEGEAQRFVLCSDRRCPRRCRYELLSPFLLSPLVERNPVIHAAPVAVRSFDLAGAVVSEEYGDLPPIHRRPRQPS